MPTPQRANFRMPHENSWILSTDRGREHRGGNQPDGRAVTIPSVMVGARDWVSAVVQRLLRQLEKSLLMSFQTSANTIDRGICPRGVGRKETFPCTEGQSHQRSDASLTTTAGTAPSHAPSCRTRIVRPSSFEAPIKSISTAFTRPRHLVGVAS